MKIDTSYFYQIRFFRPYEIPFSTAVWDPHWYHDFKDQKYNFIDKRGVLNGLRNSDFRPGRECENLCRGPETCISKDPYHCDFLETYAKQLRSLNPTLIEKYFKDVCGQIAIKMKLDVEPKPILIVHEAPDKLCSERIVIQQVLHEFGFECEEWSPLSTR